MYPAFFLPFCPRGRGGGGGWGRGVGKGAGERMGRVWGTDARKQLAHACLGPTPKSVCFQ